MAKTRNAPAVLLLAINALIVAMPVWAQGPEALATNAASEIMQQGLLGALAILEGFVIWYLYRQVQQANAKFLEMAIKQTEIFAEATRTLKRNEEMIEKVLDVVRG